MIKKNKNKVIEPKRVQLELSSKDMARLIKLKSIFESTTISETLRRLIRDAYSEHTK